MRARQCTPSTLENFQIVIIKKNGTLFLFPYNEDLRFLGSVCGLPFREIPEYQSQGKRRASVLHTQI